MVKNQIKSLSSILVELILQLLKFLHMNLSFTMNNHRCRSTNGVPQGMTTSPMLFDIYTQSLLQQIEQNKNEYTFVRLFADDLVILCRYSYLNNVINILEKWSLKMNMKINKSKSAILLLNSRPDPTQQPANGEAQTTSFFREYQISKQYKYLGTIISEQLSMVPHLKQTARKINFIAFKLRSIIMRGHFRLNCNLFKIFIMPNFRMLLTLYQYADSNQARFIQKQLRQHFRKFVRLPQSCPNEFITAVIEDVQTMAASLKKISEIKIQARNTFRSLTAKQGEEVEKIKGQNQTVKFLASQICKLIQVSYIYNFSPQPQINAQKNCQKLF